MNMCAYTCMLMNYVPCRDRYSLFFHRMCVCVFCVSMFMYVSFSMRMRTCGVSWTNACRISTYKTATTNAQSPSNVCIQLCTYIYIQAFTYIFVRNAYKQTMRTNKYMCVRVLMHIHIHVCHHTHLNLDVEDWLHESRRCHQKRRVRYAAGSRNDLTTSAVNGTRINRRI
jgi:hypothetical protein